MEAGLGVGGDDDGDVIMTDDSGKKSMKTFVSACSC